MKTRNLEKIKEYVELNDQRQALNERIEDLGKEIFGHTHVAFGSRRKGWSSYARRKQSKKLSAKYQSDPEYKNKLLANLRKARRVKYGK